MDCREQLIQALDFAGRTGSFHKRNIIENAENVCVYGLGRYFEEAFIRHDVRKRFHVTMLSDKNRQRLEEVAADERYAGMKCVSPEDIPEDAAVILMLGNPESAIKELRAERAEETYVNLMVVETLFMDDHMGGNRDKAWFLGQKSEILRLFDMLYDEESKRVFANYMCGRIAPQYYERDMISPYLIYFPKDLFSLTKDEAFVDCGAYTGDTIESFVEVTGGQFERLDAFELDGENLLIARDCIAKMDGSVSSRIHLWTGGVAEQNAEIQYGKMASASGYSIYNPRETETAKVFSLDSALGKEKVTMIKMDVEGAEQSALKGAADIIRTQKPKMAISAYHRLEDIWQIPLYLKKLVPEYKIGIRTHICNLGVDTVCYAYL